MANKAFKPHHGSHEAEVALTGDILAPGAISPSADYYNPYAPGGAMPEYGGLLDLGPGEFNAGDLQALNETGSLGLVHSLATRELRESSLRAASSGDRGKPSSQYFAPSGKPNIVGLRPDDGGLLAARAQLGGRVSKPAQDALITTAAQMARMEQLGRRALGAIPGTDQLAFLTMTTGTLHQVDGLREGTGADAFAVRQLLINQYFTQPYKAYYSTSTPASGTAINMKAVIPANVNVPVVAILVRISSNALNANRTKVMGFQLASGAGGVQNQTYYRAQISYDETGAAELIFIPALSIDGEYFPLGLICRDDAVLANDLDIFINVTGTDGATDTVTAALLGPAHAYVKKLRSRLI